MPLVMRDSSGNGRHGSYLGSPINVPGLVTDDSDQAKSFPTNSDYGTVPEAAWNQSAIFSINATIKLTSTAAYQTIASHFYYIGSGGVGGGYTFRFDPGGKLSLWIFNSPTTLTLIEYATGISAGVTYDVGCSFSAPNAKLYLNGTQVQASAVVTAMGSSFTAPFTIGGDPYNEPLIGVCDDLSFYTSVLTGTDFANLATKRADAAADYAAAVLALSPAAYYRLGDGLAIPIIRRPLRGLITR